MRVEPAPPVLFEPRDITVWVRGPAFRAGLIIRDGHIYCTAPIIRAMRGMSAEVALEHMRRNGYDYEVIAS
jgi:hypothetical protein